MNWFWTSVLLCCMCATSGFAQLKTSDKGRYVTGIIDPNNQGLITIRRSPGTNFDPIMTYPQKSFISVKVGDKIFTNNHTGTNVSNDPRFGGLLNNGVSTRIADTIRTTWTGKNGCDIIQEIYPVTFGASGQIVMRWKVKNNDPKWGIKCQNQLLLDLQIGGQTPNDGAKVLTQDGYHSKWQKFEHGRGTGVPWFFSAFENDPPNAPSFQTGVASIGYNQDAMYKLGLKRPSIMAYGDWGSPIGTAALVDFLWGISASAPWGSNVTDAAMFLQWDEVIIQSGQTVELSRTSYGTPEYGICTGQIYGIVFYPKQFKWKASRYDPDTATVEFYAFNVYSPIPTDPTFGPPSNNTSIRLMTGPSLRIISPDTNITLNKRSQEQQVGINGTIEPSGLGVAKWKIVAEEAGNMPFLDSWLKFTAKSSFSGTGPIFFNSGDGDTCEHLVKIEVAVTDSSAPTIGPIDSSSRYQRTFKAYEILPSDRSIRSVAFRRAAGTPTTFKLDTLVTPVITEPCTLDSVEITVRQADSTIGGCVEVLITDCVDNVTIVPICFVARVLPDTIPPVIILDTTRHAYLGVHIRDSVKYDLGIDTVWFVARTQTDTANFTIGKAINDGDCPHSLYYEITQLDTNVGGCFTVNALDCAGNLTTSRLYCFPVAEGSVEEGTVESIELLGNPASERTTLRINVSAAYAAMIRVVDLTGREVQVQQAMLLAGRNDLVIGTSGLAEGTYYVIADWDGRSYAKKLSVIK